MLSEPCVADRSPVSDMDFVLQCAGALGVGEFRLFKLADRWWHGDDRPEEGLEPLFAHYLRTGAAPLWVRWFCRTVLDLAAQGRLDPRQFGARPLRTVPLAGLGGEDSLRARLVTPLLVLVTLLLLAACVV